ncbi:hypothetical protein [Burkholderia sp. PU8-34]
MTLDSMNVFANIVIEPCGTLSETAALLGRALDQLQFQEETQRAFDEYPAYVAERDGLRYALLGTPEPEDDIRDDPSEDFELIVRSGLADPGAQKVDISEELIVRIRASGLLECRLLG